MSEGPNKKTKHPVPPDLPPLLEDMAREVLLNAPQDIYGFLADYVAGRLKGPGGRGGGGEGQSAAQLGGASRREGDTSVQDVYRRPDQMKLESNQDIPSKQGYPGAGLGYPEAGQGYPGTAQGDPEAGQTYPGAGQGYPDSGQGYPGTAQGYPEAGQGYPDPAQVNSKCGDDWLICGKSPQWTDDATQPVKSGSQPQPSEDTSAPSRLPVAGQEEPQPLCGWSQSSGDTSRDEDRQQPFGGPEQSAGSLAQSPGTSQPSRGPEAGFGGYSFEQSQRPPSQPFEDSLPADQCSASYLGEPLETYEGLERQPGDTPSQPSEGPAEPIGATSDYYDPSECPAPSSDASGSTIQPSRRASQPYGLNSDYTPPPIPPEEEPKTTRISNDDGQPCGNDPYDGPYASGGPLVGGCDEISPTDEGILPLEANQAQNPSSAFGSSLQSSSPTSNEDILPDEAPKPVNPPTWNDSLQNSSVPSNVSAVEEVYRSPEQQDPTSSQTEIPPAGAPSRNQVPSSVQATTDFTAQSKVTQNLEPAFGPVISVGANAALSTNPAQSSTPVPSEVWSSTHSSHAALSREAVNVSVTALEPTKKFIDSHTDPIRGLITGQDGTLMTLGLSLVVGIAVGYSVKANIVPNVSLGDQFNFIFNDMFTAATDATTDLVHRVCPCKRCAKAAAGAVAQKALDYDYPTVSSVAE